MKKTENQVNVFTIDFSNLSNGKAPLPSSKQKQREQDCTITTFKTGDDVQSEMERCWRRTYSDEFVDDLKQAFRWMHKKMSGYHLCPEHCTFGWRLHTFYPHPRASEAMFVDFDNDQLWYTMAVWTDNLNGTMLFYVVDDTNYIVMHEYSMMMRMLVAGLVTCEHELAQKVELTNKERIHKWEQVLADFEWYE